MVKLQRNCDICSIRGITQKAIADVKLNSSFGTQWGYVCKTHYSLRMNDTLVTKLED